MLTSAAKWDFKCDYSGVTRKVAILLKVVILD